MAYDPTNGTLQTIHLMMTNSSGPKTIIRGTKGDRNTRSFIFNMQNGSIPWIIPEDAECFVWVAKADGTTYFDECVVTGPSQLGITFTSQIWAAEGEGTVELYFRWGDNEIRPAKCKLWVDDSIFNENAIESSDEFNGLLDKLLQIEEAIRTTVEAADRATSAADIATNAVGSIEQYASLAEGAAARAEEAANTSSEAVTITTENAEQSARDLERIEELAEYFEAGSGYNQRDSDLKYANSIGTENLNSEFIDTLDAWNAPLRAIKIGAKEYQSSITGIQLFDIASWTPPSLSDVSINTIPDGSILISGTPTENRFLFLIGAASDTDVKFDGVDISIKCYGLTWNAETYFMTSDAGIVIKTADRVNTASNITAVAIRLTAGREYNVRFKAMIYKVTSDGSIPIWEPYNNGLTTPTMHAPQSVNTISDLKIASSVGGRNLLLETLFNRPLTTGSIWYGQIDSSSWQIDPNNLLDDAGIVRCDSKSLTPSTSSGKQLIQNLQYSLMDIEPITFDEPYTISLYVNVEHAGTNNPLEIISNSIYTDDTNDTSTWRWTPLSAATNGWVKVSKQLRYTRQASLNIIPSFTFKCMNGSTVSISKPKLTKGLDSSYNPAVKDVTYSTRSDYSKWITVVELSDVTLTAGDEIIFNGDTVVRESSNIATTYTTANPGVWEALPGPENIIYFMVVNPKSTDNSVGWCSHFEQITMQDRKAGFIPRSGSVWFAVPSTELSSPDEAGWIEYITTQSQLGTPLQLVLRTSETSSEVLPDNIVTQFKELRTYSGGASSMYSVSTVKPYIYAEYLRNADEVVNDLSSVRNANAVIGNVTGLNIVSPTDAFTSTIIDGLIDGITTQSSESGNQLFDMSSYSGFYSPGVKTAAVINNALNVTSNGLNTDIYIGNISSSNSQNIYQEVLPDTDYYISWSDVIMSNPNNIRQNKFYVGYFDSDKTWLTYTTFDLLSDPEVNYGKTFHTPANTAYITHRFGWVQTDAVADETMTVKDIMINLGTTGLPWEAFVGGEPSPNLYYPEPVTTSKDLTVVSSVSELNLMDDTQNLTQHTHESVGWSFVPESRVTRSKEDNFTVITMSASGETGNAIAGGRQLIHRSRLNMISGDDLIFSVQIRISDMNIWNLKIPVIFELFDKNYARIGYQDIHYNDSYTNRPTFINGVWTHFEYSRKLSDMVSDITYTSGKTFDDVVYITFRLLLYRNGNISFKQPKLGSGTWSPSINDMSKLSNRWFDNQYACMVSLKDSVLYGQENVRDTIDCVDNVWGVTKRYLSDTKSLLSGRSFTALPTAGCYTLYFGGSAFRTGGYIFCDYLKGTSGSNNYNMSSVVNSIGISPDRINIYVPNLTLDDVNTKLLPILTFVAELQHPIFEPFDELTQVELQKLVIYSGQDSIVKIINGTDAFLNITYVKDTNKLVNNLQNDIANSLSYSKRQTDALFSNAATGVAEGLGSVNLLLANKAPMMFKSEGRTNQGSTFGYNQLNMLSAVGGTSNGVTAVMNTNGTFVASATREVTDAINIWFMGNYNRPPETSEIILVLEPDHTYYVKDVKLFGVENGVIKGLSSEDGREGSKGKFTITAEDYPNGFRVTGIRFPDVPEPAVFNNKTFYPMVSVDIDTPWELFTGGIPSPNPEYRRSINNTVNPKYISSVSSRNILAGASMYSISGWTDDGWGNPGTRFQSKTDHYLLRGTYGWAKAWVNMNAYIGRTITIQFDVKVSDDSTAPYVYFSILGRGAPNPFPDATKLYNTRLDGVSEWKHIEYTHNMQSGDVLGFHARMYDYVNGVEDENAAEGTDKGYILAVMIKNVKISLTNAADEWTPPIEDITSENAETHKPYINIMDLNGYTLRGQGDVYDTIDNVNGVWGIWRNFAQVTIQNVPASLIGYDSGGVNTSYILWNQINDGVSVPGYTTMANIKSDQYIVNTPHKINNDTTLRGPNIGIGGSTGNNSKAIFLGPYKDLPFRDIPAFKAWLDVHPFELMYPLESPVFEVFPKNIQDQLQNLDSYAGESSIMYAIADVLPYIKCTYIKDINSVIKDIYAKIAQN